MVYRVELYEITGIMIRVVSEKSQKNHPENFLYVKKSVLLPEILQLSKVRIARSYRNMRVMHARTSLYSCAQNIGFRSVSGHPNG